jgi:acyl-CoA synthetase (NDP forming)
LLDPGLLPVNPLDAWGAGGANADQIMADSFTALLQDENAAIGAVVHDRAPRGEIYVEYLDYLRAAHQATGKPAFLVANRQGTGADPVVPSATREGFPVIDGLSGFLRGAKCLFDYRDFQNRLKNAPEQSAKRQVAEGSHWRERLSASHVLDEFESGTLLQDFGMPVNPAHIAVDEDAVQQAAQAVGFPVVLKTAAEGVAHKTEHDGVRLNLADAAALSIAYQDISARLGPRVLVSHMIDTQGIEMMLGMTRDEQFGPLIVLGAGGVNAEIIRDCAYALPPLSVEQAHTLLNSLQTRLLLDGHRGAPRLAIQNLSEMVSNFSQLAVDLSDVVSEIDMNPVVVSSTGCVVVDALVVSNQNDGDN